MFVADKPLDVSTLDLLDAADSVIRAVLVKSTEIMCVTAEGVGRVLPYRTQVVQKQFDPGFNGHGYHQVSDEGLCAGETALDSDWRTQMNRIRHRVQAERKIPPPICPRQRGAICTWCLCLSAVLCSRRQQYLAGEPVYLALKASRSLASIGEEKVPGQQSGQCVCNEVDKRCAHIRVEVVGIAAAKCEDCNDCVPAADRKHQC